MLRHWPFVWRHKYVKTNERQREQWGFQTTMQDSWISLSDMIENLLMGYAKGQCRIFELILTGVQQTVYIVFFIQP